MCIICIHAVVIMYEAVYVLYVYMLYMYEAVYVYML